MSLYLFSPNVDFAFGVKFLLFLTLGVCALLVVLVDREKALITSVRISRMFSKSLDFPGFFLQLLWFSNTLHVNLIKGGGGSCRVWRDNLCVEASEQNQKFRFGIYRFLLKVVHVNLIKRVG